jgi:hypothetical protein
VLRKLIRQDVFTEIGFIHNVPSTVDMDAVKEKIVLLKLSRTTYNKHKGGKYVKNLTGTCFLLCVPDEIFFLVSST